MIVYSAKLGQLVVDDAPFASGGAGQIYRGRSVSGGVSYCVKIIVSPKPDDFDKIRHMVDNPPATTSSGWGQLCWPLDLISTNESGVPQGYVMPMAEAGSVELSNLTVLRWPSRNHSPLSQKLDRRSEQGMARRMLVACNIAAAVQEVHRMGCVFVDLKPQNVLIGPQGAVSLVDLDSLQLSTLSRTYHGPLGSPEYMPPESYGLDFSSPPVISPSWDLFSLAVIIYEMLFGIHPFTASANPSLVSCETIDESIRLGMYVHGKNRDKLALIPAPHEALKLVPAGIVDLFRRAFDSVGPTDRTSAQAWGEALKAAADAGAVALPPEVYGPSGKHAVAAAALSAGQGVPPQGFVPKPCIGEPVGCCSEALAGRVQYGQPNAIHNLVGVYYCPQCIARKTDVTTWRRTAPCHGAYGKSCPHESDKTPRAGTYSATMPNGNTVYLCDHCYKSHIGQPVSSPTPKPALVYDRNRDDELLSAIKEWGPLAAFIGGMGYLLYLKYKKNTKRR